LVNDRFWEVIKEFNFLMNSAIKSPNCLNICHGDCCSIKINVPKILAEDYIKKGYACKEDFIRSDVFSFKLRFDEEKGKCFLYDKNINGCSVHNSGIKPPQCWIYPTQFSNPELKEIKCKRANGWEIIDFKKTKVAEEVLQYYVFLCQLEARKEFKKIIERLNSSILEKNLKFLLKNTPPSQIAGFKDAWDCITTLSAEGISLQLKKFCSKRNVCNFLECISVCDKVISRLFDFLQENLYYFIKNNGPDTDGEYPFLNLCEFSKTKIKN